MEVNVALSLPRDVASVPVTRQVLDSCLERLGVIRRRQVDGRSQALELTGIWEQRCDHAHAGSG